ncbi:MAG: hypothetical protein ACO4AU_15355 [bacterium]|jgi:hypothetical protein
MKKRTVTFVTCCTPNAFEQMAKELAQSCKQHGVRTLIRKLPMEGRGRNFYGHAMIQCLPDLDAALCDGPVALVDADQLLVADIPDSLWNGSWKVAAVNRRGKRDMVQIYGVAQNYLSSVVLFNNKDPEFARMFMLEWTRLTHKIGLKPSGHEMAKSRDEFYVARHWKPTWFCDQAALNKILEKLKASSPGDVLDLSKDIWSARKPGGKAIMVHYKGVRGKGYDQKK